MGRVALDLVQRRLEAAYRRDGWHSLLTNLEDVRPDEWDARPPEWRSEVFGPNPELSIADIVVHVGGAKQMYANHAFGDRTMRWDTVPLPPSRSKDDVLAWLDAAHATFAAGVAGLVDDEELANEREAAWGAMLRTEQIIFIVVNHDLYHAGELNRQRTLVRGAGAFGAG